MITTTTATKASAETARDDHRRLDSLGGSTGITVHNSLLSLGLRPAEASQESPVTDSRFRILTVCTGNICRSPVAERLLRAGLGNEVTVSSAGVRAVVGAPIHPGMVALLEESGIRADGFAARQVTPREIRSADLVLALTRDHRARLVQEAPGALRRSFTLLELARLVTSPDLPPVPSGPVDIRLRALVLWAARHRAAPPVGDGDDVPDPYGHGDAEYELAYRLIHAAVDTIARVARG